MRPALLLSLVAVAGCRPEAVAPPSAPAAVPRPAMATAADTLALGAYDAMGGPEVWTRVPLLRFDFASAQDGQPPAKNRRRHLWNRMTGDYRLESVRGDSVYVVLFNTQTRAGEAFQSPSRTDTTNVQPVPEAQRQAWLDRAYRSFVNDTYWLLQPTKLFDDGVARAYDADSSRTGRRVIRLSFGNVGLTPGDRYWLYFEGGKALPAAWRFHLQGDAAPGPLVRSEGDTTLATPFGPATLRTRHRMASGRSILTDHVALPATVDARVFTNPRVWMAD